MAEKRQMFRIIFVITLAFILLMFIRVFPVSAQQQKDWTGKLSDGTVVIKMQMNNILEEHKKWLETEGRKGKQAIIHRADLSGADLSGADLNGADLRQAILERTDLGRTILKGTIMPDGTKHV